MHYNAKDYDFGGAKAFPLRDQHFFTSIFKVSPIPVTQGRHHGPIVKPSPTLLVLQQAEEDLDWRPEFGLVDGLKDSYEKDFGRGNFRKAADFTTDDIILKA